MKKKLWSGRFSKQTHPHVEQYTASIGFDHVLALEDILGSLAHSSMLAHCGIIDNVDCEKIHIGLKNIATKIIQGEIKFCIEDEDIHMNIERLLHAEIGAVAGKLHTARSRNDQVALDMHLYLRKHTIAIVELLLGLQETLLQLAMQHRTIVMPGYTHLQRAQPIYLAQHWLAYVNMLQRDIQRLQDFWPRINRSPLGACALTGTTFAIDRHVVANILGFDGIYINPLDAVSNRDFIIEFLSCAAVTMMHISRLSEELILWSSQEFNFISFDDAFCTGSSIMPQKKNPDVAELARGKTGRVYAALFSMLTLMKALPLAYNKDMQEDKEPVFDVVHTLTQTLSIFIPLLSTLHINSDVMRDAAQHGFLNATALAEYLVKQGLTFRVAHEITGKLVADCSSKNCCLEDLSLAELQHYSACIDVDVYDVLSIEHAVAACQQNTSTPSSTLIDDELTQHQQQWDVAHHWFEEKDAMLKKVYAVFEV